MGKRTGGRAAAAVAFALALACGADHGGGTGPLPTEIALENALPGDRGWVLHQRAGPGQLEGYAGATSVQRGQPIDVHVRADAPHRLAWKLYRMGWYRGAEGRLFASGGPVDVGPQPT